MKFIYEIKKKKKRDWLKDGANVLQLIYGGDSGRELDSISHTSVLQQHRRRWVLIFMNEVRVPTFLYTRIHIVYYDTYAYIIAVQ